jgi:hypothetical protein
MRSAHGINQNQRQIDRYGPPLSDCGGKSLNCHRSVMHISQALPRRTIDFCSAAI